MTFKTSVASSIAALLLSPAFGIEAPADNTPPPAGEKPGGEAADKDFHQEPEALVAKPFLGIRTSPVADMVAEHLGLEAGQGVAVEMVAPDGPAAKAGIHQNDIITRLDGKPISSHEDVARAVNAHKPGEKIRLDVIQKGKSKEIEAVLGVRPAGADEALNPLENLPLDGIPEELADRIRKNIKGNIGGLQLHLLNPEDPDFKIEGMEDMEKLRKNMEKLRENHGAKGMFDIQGGFQSSVSFADNEGSVELKTTKDGKEVTVKDKDKKVVWSGPWDTEQDKEAAPPDVRKRIEGFDLDKGKVGGMLKIFPKMMGPGADPDKEDNADEGDAGAPQEDKGN